MHGFAGTSDAGRWTLDAEHLNTLSTAATSTEEHSALLPTRLERGRAVSVSVDLSQRRPIHNFPRAAVC